MNKHISETARRRAPIQWKNYYMVFLLAALCVIFSMASPQFLTVNNWSNLLITQVTTGTMALGAISVLILGEFDVSLGYMISFCMMLGAVLSERGLPGPAVMLAMVGAGAFFGLMSGLFTVKMNISSFIATLGVGILLFGLNLAISNGEVHSSGIPKMLLTLGQGKLFKVGYCVWVLIALCLLMHFFLNHTTLGRGLYAVGGSEKVAFLAGLSTGRIRILAFVLAGAFTGLAAVFQLGQAGAANPSSGPNLLMPTYAIVFLGATAFQTGVYNVRGLALAIILLGVGSNGINLIGAPSWAEFIYNGGVLVLAIFIAQREIYRTAHGDKRRAAKSPASEASQ
ncbi:MAG: ABC transporter permease [Eubacteriales bacterium]|nr:ABC transporter permease [Eubacteriales bacterium]